MVDININSNSYKYRLRFSHIGFIHIEGNRQTKILKTKPNKSKYTTYIPSPSFLYIILTNKSCCMTILLSYSNFIIYILQLINENEEISKLV